MPAIDANGITLFYEEFGAKADPAFLLIAGFGQQMLAWNADFCHMLAAKGFRVIRVDNRETGLSSKSSGAPPVLLPKPPGEKGYPMRLVGPAPYALSMLAADAIGLLDALGIAKAHIAGASMGGMIVQRTALNYPARVLSMTSIMSSTGSSEVGQATPEADAALFSPPPVDRDSVIAHAQAVFRVFSGPLFDADETAWIAGEAFDRCYNPGGAEFQLAAVIADVDRTESLAGLSCPTLVIHGAADTLIDLSGGEATAKAIDGSELLVLQQMGHNLPRQLWPEITEAMGRVARRA